MRHARRAPNRRAVQVSIEFCRMSRSTKTRSPTTGGLPAGPNHSACQNKPRFCESQAQYPAFVRFAVASSAALSAIALKVGPGFWNLSLGRALLFLKRTLASTVASTGPATLDRRCGRNVVVPEQYSKRFFCVPIGLYRGKYRPVTARRIPARSNFGGPAGTNPAAVSNPWTSPLWPSPTSTARVPPGANNRVASGAIRR